MEEKIEQKTELEGEIEIIIKEEDYIESFKNMVRRYKGKKKKNGFRGSTTPNSIFYQRYGWDVMQAVCFGKVKDKIQEIKTRDIFQDNIYFDIVLTHSTFPTKNDNINYSHPGDFVFKYMYGMIKNGNIDAKIMDKLRDINIEQIICQEIQDEDLNEIIFNSKVQYISKKMKTIVDNDNDIIYALNLITKKQLFLPAKIIIDGVEKSFYGLKREDIIHLDVKDITTLQSSPFWLEQLKRYISNGENKFQILDIRMANMTYAIYDFMKTIAINNDNNDNINCKWLYEILFINDATINNVTLQAITDEQSDIYKSTFKNIICDHCNYLLQRYFRAQIRAKCIENIDISIPEDFLKTKVKMSFNLNDVNVLNFYVNNIIKSIKWECIREAFIKKDNITCEKDDIIIFNRIKTFIENNNTFKMLDKIASGQKNKNTLIFDDFSNDRIAVLDLKVLYNIIKNINVVKVRKDYNECLSIFKTEQ